MNWPWTGRTGLAKAAATLSTVLLLSSGICGMNFFASQLAPRAVGIWIFLGIMELTTMALSALGLLIVLLLWAGRAIWRSLSHSNGD